MWLRVGRCSVAAVGGFALGSRAGVFPALCDDAGGAQLAATTSWFTSVFGGKKEAVVEAPSAGQHIPAPSGDVPESSGHYLSTIDKSSVAKALPVLPYTPPFERNKENGVVYLDLAENGVPIGRVEVEVFDDQSPLLAVNFKALSTGFWKGLPIMTKSLMQHRNHGDKKQITYLNTPFFQVKPGYMAVGGDTKTYIGKGGESFCGEMLRDSFKGKGGKIPGPGCVCAVNHGRHTNQSQFFISYRALPHLEGRNSCFGQVVSGWEVLKYMESTSSTSGMTKNEITIQHCGIVKHKSGSMFDPYDPIAVTKQVEEWTQKGASNLSNVSAPEINHLERRMMSYDYIAPTWMFDANRDKTKSLAELSADPAPTV
eukprot:TRINITY_DN30286_c0_g1_i1.p1 TRINITY_DN30286_c0_g1~~TRINITY_DN30286_c0_g1_i1.p1  ORF type:complete len:370 (+),score=95.59 TRINITY_DN30286_c0_g1_i1:52-1161(+)